ncbi:hypothetical protein E3N88_44184 [Mikania micrantha]|uniref:Subtilisin-like protease fibronectin type-III domain-containing protein n=1 Tax=Mikania micrantha TaxID=192012 RepID=A0A5N6LCZ6_9ASTR|nr:hypothetical protein E3N88_44184 [Mikania micrantha]
MHNIMNLFKVLLSIFITLCVLQSSSCLAIKTKKSYIVYLGGLNHELEPDQIKDSHFEFLGSMLGSKEIADEAMIYSYNKQFNGFAAILDDEDAARIAEHPDVVTVIENKGRKLHTTHSWDFLKLEKHGSIGSSSLWKKARFGENIIIANLDTGVWPESKSFNGTGFGPIPSKWKGGCENETLVPCNNKLIGAKYYNKGYQASYMKMDPSMKNARDHEGHGSHTLSTAGGNFVPGVSVNGVWLGTAKGGSPRARVAAYKVCWPPTLLGGECDDADIVKGFESAIHDGVDVLSVSLGGLPADYMDDGLAIASFHAVKKGITVVFSAGNDGPYPGTVTNVAPWVITVGASTIDREFQSFVNLASGLNLKGLSMSKPLQHSGFYPLINAADANAKNATVMNASLCSEGTLDSKKVKGKILVCLRGGSNGRVDKGTQAALAGAVGMILCNDETSGDEIIADPHVLPATHITYTDSLRLNAYLNSTKASPMMDETKNEASPFSRGAGHIDPNRAANPGLVYDLTANDYLDFLCTRGYNKTMIQKFSDEPYQCPENNSILDFNYPSITVHKLNGTVTVSRRLTNVGPNGSYTVDVKRPAGISVEVKPQILSFGKKGEVQKFELTMRADGTRVIKDYVFGELTWSNGKHHHVKSPIVVSVA